MYRIALKPVRIAENALIGLRLRSCRGRRQRCRECRSRSPTSLSVASVVLRLNRTNLIATSAVARLLGKGFDFPVRLWYYDYVIWMKTSHGLFFFRESPYTCDGVGAFFFLCGFDSFWGIGWKPQLSAFNLVNEPLKFFACSIIWSIVHHVAELVSHATIGISCIATLTIAFCVATSASCSA